MLGGIIRAIPSNWIKTIEIMKLFLSRPSITGYPKQVDVNYQLEEEKTNQIWLTLFFGRWICISCRKIFSGTAVILLLLLLFAIACSRGVIA